MMIAIYSTLHSHFHSELLLMVFNIAVSTFLSPLYKHVHVYTRITLIYGSDDWRKMQFSIISLIPRIHKLSFH